jgi:hypothetical protein
MRQRTREGLKAEGEARAHRGDRNRASISTGTAESIEQIRAARRRFGVIERRGSERTSRGFYSRLGLARGLGFRQDRTDVRDAVFGSVSCSR